MNTHFRTSDIPYKHVQGDLQQPSLPLPPTRVLKEKKCTLHAALAHACLLSPISIEFIRQSFSVSLVFPLYRFFPKSDPMFVWDGRR